MSVTLTKESYSISREDLHKIYSSLNMMPREYVNAICVFIEELVIAQESDSKGKES